MTRDLPVPKRFQRQYAPVWVCWEALEMGGTQTFMDLLELGNQTSILSCLMLRGAAKFSLWDLSKFCSSDRKSMWPHGTYLTQPTQHSYYCKFLCECIVVINIWYVCISIYHKCHKGVLQSVRTAYIEMLIPLGPYHLVISWAKCFCGWLFCWFLPLAMGDSLFPEASFRVYLYLSLPWCDYQVNFFQKATISLLLWYYRNWMLIHEALWLSGLIVSLWDE